MAKLSKPPIPLTMYKHFAVVTLALTATIAMFADSGQRQAIAGHIEERERETALREASAERFGQPQLVRRDEGERGSFGNEAADYGAPTVTVQSNGGGSRRRGTRTAAPQDLASLTEEEREALEGAPTGYDIAAIERASARRSGREGVGSDAPD